MTDLTGSNFTNWLVFLQNEASPDDIDSQSFLYKWDNVEAITHSSELFCRAGDIWDQLGSGAFVKILTTIKINFLPELANPSIPTELAIRCIHNMHRLFDDVFSKDPLGDICFMWFDNWPQGMSGDRRNYAATNEALFSLLSTLLFKSQTREVQRAVLHGLGHRPDHPRAKVIIDQFLRERANLDAQLKEYARTCANGDIV